MLHVIGKAKSQLHIEVLWRPMLLLHPPQGFFLVLQIPEVGGWVGP